MLQLAAWHAVKRTQLGHWQLESHQASSEDHHDLSSLAKHFQASHLQLLICLGLLQSEAWHALKHMELGNGQLLLSQMRRVRQLGSGDVGLVDLVELNDGKQM